MKKRESFKERIMYKKYGKRIWKFKRCSMRFHHGRFMFRVSMDDRREAWLNDRRKFYSQKPLRDFNLGRKRLGWTLTSIQEWKKRNERVVYWGEY